MKRGRFIGLLAASPLGFLAPQTMRSEPMGSCPRCGGVGSLDLEFGRRAFCWVCGGSGKEEAPLCQMCGGGRWNVWKFERKDGSVDPVIVALPCTRCTPEKGDWALYRGRYDQVRKVNADYGTYARGIIQNPVLMASSRFTSSRGY